MVVTPQFSIPLRQGTRPISLDISTQLTGDTWHEDVFFQVHADDL